MLLMLFLRDILDNIVRVETKRNLKKDKLKVASFGEFLQWIGIWILCLLCLVSGTPISGAVRQYRPSGELHIADISGFLYSV